MHFWSSQKSLVDIVAMYFREVKRKQNIHLSKCHLAFESKGTIIARKKPIQNRAIISTFNGERFQNIFNFTGKMQLQTEMAGFLSLQRASTTPSSWTFHNA